MGQGDSDGWRHFTTDTTRKGTHENVLLTLIEPLRCVQLCLAIKSAHTVDMKLEKKSSHSTSHSFFPGLFIFTRILSGAKYRKDTGCFQFCTPSKSNEAPKRGNCHLFK